MFIDAPGNEVLGEIIKDFALRPEHVQHSMLVLDRPKMMIRGYRMKLMKLKCVQIPVNHKKRTGQSSVTRDPGRSNLLGGQMLVLIAAMRFRLESWLLRFLR
jgi:hypothetical protein